MRIDAHPEIPDGADIVGFHLSKERLGRGTSPVWLGMIAQVGTRRGLGSNSSPISWLPTVAES